MAKHLSTMDIMSFNSIYLIQVITGNETKLCKTIKIKDPNMYEEDYRALAKFFNDAADECAKNST